MMKVGEYKIPNNNAPNTFINKSKIELTGLNKTAPRQKKVETAMVAAIPNTMP